MIDGPSDIAYVGLDLISRSCVLDCEDVEGRVLVRTSIDRQAFLRRMSGLPLCIVGMEAAAGVHGMAFDVAALGHRVASIDPRTIVIGTDDAASSSSHARALCRMIRQDTVRSLPIRSVEERRSNAVGRVGALLPRRRQALFAATRTLLDEFSGGVHPGDHGGDRPSRCLSDVAAAGDSGDSAAGLLVVLGNLNRQIANLDRLGPQPPGARRVGALSSGQGRGSALSFDP